MIQISIAITRTPHAVAIPIILRDVECPVLGAEAAVEKKAEVELVREDSGGED